MFPCSFFYHLVADFFAFYVKNLGSQSSYNDYYKENEITALITKIYAYYRIVELLSKSQNQTNEKIFGYKKSKSVLG